MAPRTKDDSPQGIYGATSCITLAPGGRAPYGKSRVKASFWQVARNVPHPLPAYTAAAPALMECHAGWRRTDAEAPQVGGNCRKDLLRTFLETVREPLDCRLECAHTRIGAEASRCTAGDTWLPTMPAGAAHGWPSRLHGSVGDAGHGLIVATPNRSRDRAAGPRWTTRGP